MSSFGIRKVLFLCLVLRSAQASVTVFQRASDNFSEERNSSADFISCSSKDFSDPSQTELVRINISDIDDIIATSHTIVNVYKFADSQRNKVNYEKCVLCSYHVIKCADNVNLERQLVCFRRSIYKGNPKYGDCEKHIVRIKGFSEWNTKKRSSDERINQGEGEISLDNQPVDEYFEDIHIPIGGLKHRSRQSRSMVHCALPSSMLTADAYCRVFPSVTKCVQRCAFGHTLESGIQQMMECSNKDGVWKPTKFKECKPFVDCALTINSGGFLSCSTMSVTDSPECRVSCLHYEDKDAVPAQNYKCNIEGKWDPPLPFCVTPGSGMMLTKAPQIKLHENLK